MSNISISAKTAMRWLLVICLACFINGFAQNVKAEKKALWDILPPEGKELYGEWSNFIGQTSLEMVEANDPAPEVKPGTVITPENAASFPNLEKVLDPVNFKRISSRNSYAHIEKIEVVETRPWYFSKEILDSTKINNKEVQIDPEKRQLLNWYCGIPFPFPKTGTELMYDVLFSFIAWEPVCCFEPMTIVDLDGNGNQERIRKANLYVIMCMGRQRNLVGPKNVLPGYEYGDIYQWGALSFVFPQDMKGLSFVRTRYWDAEKPDSFVGYIPSMRRIRTLSGSDAQDPIAGSEYTWDMWGGEWQKQASNKLFPNDYKLLGEKTLLFPCKPFSVNFNLEGDQITQKWEKRRVFILEIDSRDPSYYYSKRIIYVDKETLKGVHFEYYDRKGNLWRTWTDNWWFNPKVGIWSYQGADIVNWIDNRRTVLVMNATYDPQHVTADYFNLKFLARETR